MHIHVESAEVWDIFYASYGFKCQVRHQMNPYFFHMSTIVFITLVGQNLLHLVNNKESYAM